jgi:hypothetical protein
MILLALAGSTIGKWWYRAMLALVQPATRSQRDVPQAFYRFPLF